MAKRSRSLDIGGTLKLGDRRSRLSRLDLRRFIRQHWYPYLLVLPVVLLIIGIMVYPLAYGIGLSLENKGLLSSKSTFIGLANYTKLLRDSVFWKALGNSLIWTILGVVGTISLGFVLALLLNRPIRGRALFRTLFMLPWAMPTIVTGIIFTWLYDAQFGYVNQYLQQLNLITEPILFLVKPKLALFAAAAPMVWKFFPFAMLVLLAALQAINQELYDAAMVDGAGRWRAFVHVTLPGIRPTLTILVLLEFIWVFNVFDFVYILTRGGPAHATELLSTYSYASAFNEFRASYGAAIATVQFLILFAFSLLYFRFLGTEESER